MYLLLTTHRDAIEQGAIRGACRARGVTLGGEGLIGKAIVSIAMVTLGCEGLARGRTRVRVLGLGLRLERRLWLGLGLWLGLWLGLRLRP